MSMAAAGSGERQRRGAPAPRSVDATVSRMAAGEAPPTVDPQVPFSVRIPESLRKRVRVASVTDDRSTQDITAEALEAWLERRERRLRGGDANAD